MKKIKLNQGFTLIELLVVIAIIGILVVAGSVSYQRSVRLSRDGKRASDLEQIRQALETYRSENGSYPETANFTTALTGTYINTIPTDPQPTTNSYYYVRTATTAYSLCAKVEGTPSKPGSCGGASCGTAGICNYQVTNP